MSARLPHLPSESWDLFLRDELSAEAAGRIEAHLADCAECSAALEREDPSFLFRRLRDEPAPEAALDGLWDSINAEIREIPPARRPASSRLAGWGGLRAAAAIGSAAAIIVLMSLVAFRKPAELPSQVPTQSVPTQSVPSRSVPSRSVDVAVAAEPCPAALSASLSLTREECAALYGGPIASPDAPVVMVSDSLDLRGL